MAIQDCDDAPRQGAVVLLVPDVVEVPLVAAKVGWLLVKRSQFSGLWAGVYVNEIAIRATDDRESVLAQERQRFIGPAQGARHVLQRNAMMFAFHWTGPLPNSGGTQAREVSQLYPMPIEQLTELVREQHCQLFLPLPRVGVMARERTVSVSGMSHDLARSGGQSWNEAEQARREGSPTLERYAVEMVVPVSRPNRAT